MPTKTADPTTVFTDAHRRVKQTRSSLQRSHRVGRARGKGFKMPESTRFPSSTRCRAQGPGRDQLLLRRGLLATRRIRIKVIGTVTPKQFRLTRGRRAIRPVPPRAGSAVPAPLPPS